MSHRYVWSCNLEQLFAAQWDIENVAEQEGDNMQERLQEQTLAASAVEELLCSSSVHSLPVPLY